MGEALTRVQKFVASHNPNLELPWQNSKLLKGDSNEAVAKLKKEHDKTLVIFGSGVLVRSLMKANLIDEYVLMIHPLILSKGMRLFTDDNQFTKLKLVSSVSSLQPTKMWKVFLELCPVCIIYQAYSLNPLQS